MTVIQGNVIPAETRKLIGELRARFGKEMIRELYENDMQLYKFLKARDFNLDQTEVLIRKCMDWRYKYQVNTLSTDFVAPLSLQKYMPISFLGFDKEGSPVRYFKLGYMDAKGIRQSCKFPDLVKYCFTVMEDETSVLQRQTQKLSRLLEGGVYIIDLKDFTFAMATDKKTIEHISYLARMYQDCYPECLKKAFVINVSPYFTLFFSIVKPVLAASIVEKAQFLAHDYPKELLKLIDADVLPAFLGGKRTDPDSDPMCYSVVNHGGKIPEQYFINRGGQKKGLARKEGVRRLAVPRASFSEVEVPVVEAGSLIEWEFETRSRDIGFGLYRRRLGGGPGDRATELVPLLRLDTDEFAETGMYKCEEAGAYILLFDNSYSWVRSKEIYYRTNIVTPKQHQLNQGNDVD